MASRTRGETWTKGAALVIAVAVAAACVDEPELAPPVPPTVSPGGVELIGVSGRRLLDGDGYRVPLDYDDVAIVAGAARREAFVIVNTAAEDVLVEHLAVASSDAPDLGEWRLLAPTRAREIPLAVDGMRLAPGARLDFDLGVRPALEGERSARLELVVRVAGHTEARVVHLGARCARGPP